jgi:hypothetical protein
MPKRKTELRCPKEERKALLTETDLVTEAEAGRLYRYSKVYVL